MWSPLPLLALALLSVVASVRACPNGAGYPVGAGSIQSPNYPQNYDNGANCVYHISASQGSRVMISFTAFDTEACCDYLFLYDGPAITSPVITKVSGVRNGVSFQSSGQYMTLLFTSDPTVNRPGFSGQYSSVTGPTPSMGPSTTGTPSGTSGPGIPTPPTISSNSPDYNAYVLAAQQLTQSINVKADPCNDFWSYACGNYPASSPISFYQADSNNLVIQATQIMKPQYAQPQAPLPLRQTVWYFNTCVAAQNNFGPITQGGTIVIQALQAFQQITGLPFPMLNQNQNQQNWPSANTIGTALGYLSGVAGVDTLLSPYVDTNWADPLGATPYFLYVDQNSLMYPKTYYQPGTWEQFQDGFINNIKATMTQLAGLTGKTLDPTTLTNDVMDIVKIELALARNLSTDDTTRRQFQRSYNPTSVSSAQASYPFMDWTAYFRQLSTNAPGSVPAMMNNPSFTFSVMETTKTLQLGNSFQMGNPYGFTPRQFVNYLMYRLVDSNSGFLPNFRDRRLQKKLYSPPMGKTRYIILPEPVDPEKFENKDLTSAQMECTQETLNSLSYTNARFFVDALYPDKGVNIRQAAGGLISGILSGFQSMLDQLPWMDDASKLSAYGKITSLVKNIAFPDFILDDAQLTAYYANLNIQQTDSYVTMLNKLSVFNMATQFGYLARTSGSDRTDFNGAPGIVNAWYQPELNSITFPAGILQPPFYHPQFPASVNFGGLGVVAGHELTHGYDDQGVQWDGVGKLSHWLDPSSQQGFQRLANCVINEYNGFCPLPGNYTPNCIKGSQTQGENIADNGGIHASWRAYKTHVALNGPDPRLPDPVLSQFTHDQLFFLSFGRVWCANESPAQLFRQLLVDPHSPYKYRVFGTIQNFPAFQSAFHCPSGSNYAPGPGKHCNVWVLDN